MKYRNITGRKTQLDQLQSNRMNCMVFASRLFYLDQQASETGTYFIERFKR